LRRWEEEISMERGRCEYWNRRRGVDGKEMREKGRTEENINKYM